MRGLVASTERTGCLQLSPLQSSEEEALRSVTEAQPLFASVLPERTKPLVPTRQPGVSWAAGEGKRS